MRIENRRLFFAYALPCIESTIKKGKISREKAKELFRKYEKGEELPESAEKIFEVAIFYLNKIARLMKKKSIDEVVIRTYFQKHHNKILGKGKRSEKCKVKIGKVVGICKDYVLVKVEGKTKKYKSFVKSLKNGEEVVLHWDYIVDKPERRLKILVFGNPLVEKDSLALRVAQKLKEEFPSVEFKEFDTAESLEREGKNIIILDVVEGIKKVEIISDPKKIKKSKIFSLHDFDLSYELELLKKLKLIESFRILGIPSSMKEKEALKGLRRIFSDPSYF